MEPLALTDGLYELLVTEGLAQSLSALGPDRFDAQVLQDGSESLLIALLTRHLGALLGEMSGDGADKSRRQL